MCSVSDIQPPVYQIGSVGTIYIPFIDLCCNGKKIKNLFREYPIEHLITLLLQILAV